MSLPCHLFAHRAMNTHFEIKICHEVADYAAGAAQAAFARIDEIEESLTRFKDSSDLVHVNRAPINQWVIVSPDLQHCLLSAQQVYTRTNGAFDPAFRTPGVLDTLEVDSTTPRVRKAVSIDIDLGGIGKGYALDETASLLSEWELNKALLHGGGSTVRALDAPDGTEGWRIGMGKNHKHLLVQCSLSASGLEAHGDHIVDTRGSGQSGMRRMWALAPTAVESDALATAFFMMSDDEIRAYCDIYPETSAQWVRTEPDGLQRIQCGKGWRN